MTNPRQGIARVQIRVKIGIPQEFNDRGDGSFTDQFQSLDGMGSDFLTRVLQARDQSRDCVGDVCPFSEFDFGNCPRGSDRDKSLFIAQQFF